MNQLGSEQPERPVQLRWTQVKEGWRASFAAGLGVAVYGVVFGVLFQVEQLPATQLLLMNTLLFAGAAQFVLLDLVTSESVLGLSALEVGVAIAAINSRYLVFGVSVSHLFQGMHWSWRWLATHLLTDENWAVTKTRELKYQSKSVSLGFLLGGGLWVMITWQSSTFIGYTIGLYGFSAIEPRAYGLDFAFASLFLFMLAEQWRSARAAESTPTVQQKTVPRKALKSLSQPTLQRATVWIVAGAASLVADAFLPGSWHVLVGASAGGVVLILQYTSGNKSGSRQNRFEQSSTRSL